MFSNNLNMNSHQKRLKKEINIIRDKIEILKIGNRFVNYSDSNSDLDRIKNEINILCQKYTPHDVVPKSVISHLLGALVYSKYPDKVSEIFNGIEEIIYLDAKIRIGDYKIKKEKSCYVSIIILSLVIFISVLIFAYLFRFEQSDKILIVFDRWLGEYVQKRL